MVNTARCDPPVRHSVRSDGTRCLGEPTSRQAPNGSHVGRRCISSGWRLRSAANIKNSLHSGKRELLEDGVMSVPRCLILEGRPPAEDR